MVLKTAIFFVISIAAFAVMFTTMAPLTGFLSYHDVPRIVKDNNEETNWFALTESLLWDIFLVLLFIVQHSIMATPTWRGLIYNLGLVVVERSFYIAATAWALQYIMQSWLVIPDYPLWIIDTSQSTPWWWFFTLIHVMAWIIIYGATFTMDLAELLGLKQVYYYAYGYNPPITFKSKGTQKLYRHMRHPGACCLIAIFWLHPVMTLSRCLLAGFWTIYLMFGFSVKEKDYIYLCEQLSRKQMTSSHWEMVAEYHEEEVVMEK